MAPALVVNPSAASASAPQVTLRNYQTKALGDLGNAMAALEASDPTTPARVLLVSPTGSGKTRMFAHISAERVARDQRVLVIAHRYELLTQARDKLRDAGIDRVGIYRGKRSQRDPDADLGASVQVASIQAPGIGWFKPDLVIVDEAHHAIAKSYRNLLALFPEAQHVGVTATPWWGNGQGLGAYFREVVVVTTTRELTEAGYLARARVFTHEHTLRDLDLRGVKKIGGDYEPGALGERVNKPRLVGDIVEHWHSHANGQRTLCFAASVEHSKSIVARFRRAGVTAAHLDGTTPAPERKRILDDLRSGRLPIVSNFNVLTEGFDAPEVGCVILARPTLRPQVYLQTVGRGLRMDEGTDKTSVVVLDHAGLSLFFGLPEDDRPFSLDDGTTEVPPGGGGGGGPPVPRRCPGCGIMVAVGTEECPECGVTKMGGPRIPVEDVTGILVEYVRDAVIARRGGEHQWDGEWRTIRDIAKRVGVTRNSLGRYFEKTRDINEAVRLAKEAQAAHAASVTRAPFGPDGALLSIDAIAKQVGVNRVPLKRHFEKTRDINESVRLAKEAQAARAVNITRAPFGPDGAPLSIDAIAKQAGVNGGPLKRHFEKTRDINEAIRLAKEAQAKQAEQAASATRVPFGPGGALLSVNAIAKQVGVNRISLGRYFEKTRDINEAIRLAKEAQTAMAAKAERAARVPFGPDGVLSSINAIAKQVGVSRNSLGCYFEKTRDINESVRLAKEAQAARAVVITRAPFGPDGAPLSIDAIAKQVGVNRISLGRYFEKTRDINEAIRLAKAAKTAKAASVTRVPFGPDGALLSIDAIAEQTGVSFGSLRRYFEKTRDINEAVRLAKEAQAAHAASITRVPFGPAGAPTTLNAVANQVGLGWDLLKRYFEKTRDINEAVRLAKEAQAKRRNSGTIQQKTT